MKSCVIISIIVLCLLPLSVLNAQVVGIEWNTFLGSSSDDHSFAIALDISGNFFLTGNSADRWGSPVNAHSGGSDVFVSRLESSGNLVWNTFLGSSNDDYGYGITLDSSGKIYVVGRSAASWGSPVNAHSGGLEAFVACLDSSGNLLWNTFMGSAGTDVSYAVALDSSGNIYVVGESDASWGSPVDPHIGDNDAFVACLDSSGNLLWNTFLGSAYYDYGNNLIVYSSGNIFVTGQSEASWGSPINAHSGSFDAMMACLNSSGILEWNTFFGTTAIDDAKGITMDSSRNIYVTGNSGASWGSPVNAHSGSQDMFVAKMNDSGYLQWNTFLGSTATDYGNGIVLSSSGNIYVTGNSGASWGSPINAYTGSSDAMVAALDGSGNLLWNTFMGSADGDIGHGIVLDNSENVCITGISWSTWGLPINAYSGSGDGFVAKLSCHALPDITANGSEGPISITDSDTLQIRVSLNTFGSGENVDYWLAYKGPSGWVHYNNSTKKWEAGLGVTHQGPLLDLNNKKVFQSMLVPGSYTFYFGVDMVMDGNLTKSELYYDEVKVTVTQ